MKNWKAPGLLLALLVLLFIFRWQTVGSVTKEGAINQFKLDRWSGTLYQITIDSGQKGSPNRWLSGGVTRSREPSYSENIINGPRFEFTTTNYCTFAWIFITLSTFIWFIYARIVAIKQPEKE